FVEMFVGVGASRVRDLFNKAKRLSPTVIFIDELDAVGRQRGSGMGGSHDEREQTLNQILVEMDGFESSSNVIVLAATNRPDVLDPALMRPGRFDRKVVLDLPDRVERTEILKIHAQNKPFDSKVNFVEIAKSTPGLSGADLRNITNEAAILAAREGKKKITQQHLRQSIEKTLLGPERTSFIMNQKEREIVAYHEAGHAIIGHVLPHLDDVHKVSIVSRGMALGYTLSLPNEDRKLIPQEKFEQEIIQLLGGRAAEELVFKSVTTGAGNDLDRATTIARNMVTIFGMSKLGPIKMGEREEMIFLGREFGSHKSNSEKLTARIDEEISRIVDTAWDKAMALLKKHRQVLNAMAQELLKNETLEDAQLQAVFATLKIAK
ncbi:MAG: AAA family ATPase, partial [Patescibacteria group bacterium]